MHPVVHLHIFKKGGYLFLQKRSAAKDIQPGKWDTAVGGHVDYGETVYQALLREASEELGLRGIRPELLISYIFRSEIEQEQVNVFYIIADETFSPVVDPVEIDDARFWHVDEIAGSLGRGVFTPNFEQEFQRIKKLMI